jgi:hypothetical protein
MIDNAKENAIVQFLACSPRSSIHKIAKELCEEERLVLSHVNDLCKQQKLMLTILPLGNPIEADCSVYYSLQ